IDSKRDLVRLTQTDTVFLNRHIREDLDLLNCAARMLDAVDGLCEDHSAHKDLAEMTIKALNVMNETKSTNVCGAFLFKVLSLEGFSPSAEQCPICFSSDGLDFLSIEHGAFYCANCSKPSMIKTLAHTRETMVALSQGKTSAVIENVSP